MRCSRSATPLKDFKIFSPGCVWNLSYFQHVANLHFLLILSTLLCYGSLFHIVAPGPPSSLEILSQETGDAPADHR